MKKNKLRLDQLKVKSFVTLDNENESLTIKGGLANGDQIGRKTIDTIIHTPHPTPGTWCYVCPQDDFPIR